jgi:hypothetical protein
VGTITIATDAGFTIEHDELVPPEKAPVLRQQGPVALPGGGWTFLIFHLTEIRFLFNATGPYDLYLKSEEGDLKVGSLSMVRVKLPPLTQARIAAIKSNPKAMKAVKTELRCNICNDALRAYAGLERNPRQEEEGWIWYKTLGDAFT